MVKQSMNAAIIQQWTRIMNPFVNQCSPLLVSFFWAWTVPTLSSHVRHLAANPHPPSLINNLPPSPPPVRMVLNLLKNDMVAAGASCHEGWQTSHFHRFFRFYISFWVILRSSINSFAFFHVSFLSNKTFHLFFGSFSLKRNKEGIKKWSLCHLNETKNQK